ncbi:MAG TPA: hypothetical protein VKB72_12610 [Steroidobacteraceae bacterium]|nr:hypothetical protein [Steroidobacteraceae bacterium]
MRLLDHVAQCSAPFIVHQAEGDLWRLTGANDFAQRVEHCPLRFVLADDLVSTCTALAFSEGDELSGCLDLLHLPAEAVWIEWDEVARQQELARTLPGYRAPPAEVLRAGALVSAEPQCRSGSLRTFWLGSHAPHEPLLAPVETLLDLEGTASYAAPEALLEGGAVAVRDPHSEQLNSLLQCARFRLDSAWLRYYQRVAQLPAVRADVIRRSLTAVAFDVPMLLALFLLMTIRADLVHLPVRLGRLNAKRARLGKRPLLEHIEVSAPLFAQAPPAALPGSTMRRGPRFHHVRGHIVRRRDTVYWRGPHWRGHVRLGSVRSRTVELRLPH